MLKLTKLVKLIIAKQTPSTESKKGDIRLKVQNGRSWDHYCENCAKLIISKDIEKLNKLKELNVQPIPI